ncbi:MAG: hypothetical protein RIS47_872 [Bacteroidota bacterium]|jgi:glutaminyl-tRNA synthetase
MEEVTKEKKNLNFLEQIIEEDLANNTHGGTITVRFPPEPNGYLHIGHAKSICLNFGLAQNYGGKCNLRFDDTNPAKEDVEYVESIQEDVRWLGFQWADEPKYASDYFEELYQMAVKLIKDGKAYVDALTPDEVQAYRGTITEAGRPSPWRDRPIEESLSLFERMRNGEFEDGRYLLRAKIDMAHTNMFMRDPLLYRIRNIEHHRTGKKWAIYPLYDFAHGQCDYIEGITHSICTLEFIPHRPLYEWFLEQLADPTKIIPHQYEFARLNMTYTLMSKRKLLQLVQNKVVTGWDDPRMPTISGMRRRGYTAEGIRNFAERIGVAKRDNLIDISSLEFSIREDLNKKAIRFMGVLDPIKVIITNYPEAGGDLIIATNNPEDETMGKRLMKFSREIYIERDDFMEVPQKKYHRLAPGKEVRLRYAYYITCTDFVKDTDGQITEIHCTYDPETFGGQSEDNRKIPGTIHWVDAASAIDAEVRLYEPMFTDPTPEAYENEIEPKKFMHFLNPNSLTVIRAKVEPAVAESGREATFQFERKGYFCVDKDSTTENLVINRTVTLRDSYAKAQQK